MNMYAVLCIAFCGVYGIFMVVQGLANYRKTSGSTETFYNADRGVSTFMLVCSTAVSVFSGLAFYGWPSSSYKLGVGYISGMGAFCVGLEFCVCLLYTSCPRQWPGRPGCGSAGPARRTPGG